MDVKKFAGARLWFLFLLLVVGCNQNKTSQTVFPEGNQKNGPADEACLQERINRIENSFMVSWEDGSFSVEKSENSELFIRDFLEPRLSKIRHVEFNKMIHVENRIFQTEATADNSWGQKMIQLDPVHAQGIKGEGVTVAIVDTPVDYSHPILKNQMVDGWDFVTNSANAEKPHDHATHIGGIIAGEETGAVKGLAPKAKLMGVSFMDASGSGTLGDAIKAMNYAADHGAKIINNSWGGPLCSDTMRSAMTALSDRGILLMVAAGNDGLDISRTPTYPATFTNPLQITVGASQAADIMSSFSNTSWNLVHLAAPGQEIYSAVPGGYAPMSGTSMATPFVSGAAALLYSAKPNASPMQIKQALLNSVNPGPFRVSTQGRLNVQRALDEIRRLVQ